MLTLRFQRHGKKRDFIFRIIAVDSKIAVNSGKSKEILGWWDPRINKFELKKERILYWISQGAQPSDSCYNLLVRAKIIESKKRPINIRKKKVKEGETEQAPVTGEKLAEDKPKEKVEEKTIEETKDEIKPEEKVEVKSEEKIEEKKDEAEVKEEVKQQPKNEEAKKETGKEAEEKPEEKIKEKEKEIKEEIKEKSKIEGVKEEVKEKSIKEKKEEISPDDLPF